MPRIDLSFLPSIRGQYNLAKKNSRLVQIVLLDKTSLDWPLDGKPTGLDCIQYIQAKLNFTETKYFGLKVVPRSHKNENKSPRWIDLNKPLKRQLSNAGTNVLYLRFMFYVASPQIFKEEQTRYFYFLQIRNDVFDDNLTLDKNTSVTLAAYSLQAEEGDYDVSKHTVDYLRHFYLFPNSMASDETNLIERAIESYKQLHGTYKGEAEMLYLRLCESLEGYAEEHTPVQDASGKRISIGSSFEGVIEKSDVERTFKWETVKKVDFRGSTLSLRLVNDTSPLQYFLDDSDFTKYTAKLFHARIGFYNENPEATKPIQGDLKNGVKAEYQLERRPTLRKNQQVHMRDQANEDQVQNSVGNSLASLNSVQSPPTYFSPPDYKDACRQRAVHIQRPQSLRSNQNHYQTRFEKTRKRLGSKQRPQSMVDHNRWRKQGQMYNQPRYDDSVAISSPDLVTQNLMSTSERNLPSNTTGPTSRHVHNSGFNYHGFQGYSEFSTSTPEHLHKFSGLSVSPNFTSIDAGPVFVPKTPTQPQKTQPPTLPTYDEYTSSQRSLNEVGSRSRLHLAVTQQARYNMYPAAAQNARYISKSKNSLYDVEEAPAMGLGSSYEGLSFRDQNQNVLVSTHQHSLAPPDFKTYSQITQSRVPPRIQPSIRKVPTYEEYVSRAKQWNPENILPGKPEFELGKAKPELIHGKTMSVTSSQTMVVVPDEEGQHELAVRNVVDGGLKTLEVKKKSILVEQMITNEGIYQGPADVAQMVKNSKESSKESSPQISSLDGVEQKLNSEAELRQEFASINNSQFVQKSPRVSVVLDGLDHQFLCLSNPKSNEEIYDFWKTVWREKSTIIVHLTGATDYANEDIINGEYEIRNRIQPTEDVSMISRQLNIFRKFTSRESKKRKLYYFQVVPIFGHSGRPFPTSIQSFCDVDDELGKIFNLKRRKYPITIVSDNTELYSGAFVLSRLVRFSAYYSQVPPKVNELLTSIRKSNSSFVPSFDQYEFVYRLLAHSLQKFRLI